MHQSTKEKSYRCHLPELLWETCSSFTEVVDASSLEVFKVRLDEALSNLHMAGGLDYMIFKGSFQFKPSHDTNPAGQFLEIQSFTIYTDIWS